MRVSVCNATHSFCIPSNVFLGDAMALFVAQIQTESHVSHSHCIIFRAFSIRVVSSIELWHSNGQLWRGSGRDALADNNNNEHYVWMKVIRMHASWRRVPSPLPDIGRNHVKIENFGLSENYLRIDKEHAHTHTQESEAKLFGVVFAVASFRSYLGIGGLLERWMVFENEMRDRNTRRTWPAWPTSYCVAGCK